MKIVSNGKTLEVPSGVSQDIYSLEEQVVGRWIDGRPVYEKTLIGTITANSVNDVVPPAGMSPIENIDYPVSYRMLIKYSTEEYEEYIAYIQGSIQAVFWETDKKNFAVYLGASTYVNSKIIIFAQYVKTTDQATIELPAALTVSQPTYIAAPQSAASAELRVETKNEEV